MTGDGVSIRFEALMDEPLNISPFAEILEDFRAGRMIIMADDARRENEGDLAIAAARVTPEDVAFMMREARGLVCVSISTVLAERLNLPLQVVDNNSPFQTPFAVSVDLCSSAALGVSAQARAAAMRRLTAPGACAADFSAPGHVFPLIANPAGVLGRQGQTEGSYDLARIAGFEPAGVICEILNPDGTMARGAELNEFARRHGLKITTVEQVIQYRVREEILVREVARGPLETDYGPFEAVVFEDDADGKEHLALICGNPARLRENAPLVRIHSECLTGDVFGSERCDCGTQLEIAMTRVAAEGTGLVLYLRQEGRGIGLGNKLRAYALQDKGADTVEANLELGFPADLRDFAAAARILGQLCVTRVRLLTNNPNKMNDLARFGIEVAERVPIQVAPGEHSRRYLNTKREKLGHFL